MLLRTVSGQMVHYFPPQLTSAYAPPRTQPGETESRVLHLFT